MKDLLHHLEHLKKSRIKMIKTTTVPTINLLTFLENQKIDVIDEYIIDIQGYDLHVLKRHQPCIQRYLIKKITAETAKDKLGNIYKEAPDNRFTGFKPQLNEHYYCSVTGWGILKDGKFKDVPD